MRNCPICNSSKTTCYPYNTYITCVDCTHTYQPNPPEKTYQNPDEKFNGGIDSVMDDNEKMANNLLAKWLYDKYKPSTIIDVGCAYPYLASCFKRYGSDQVIAVDGVYKTKPFVKDQFTDNVIVKPLDWEKDDIDICNVDMITMVHVLEHFYDPISCLQKAYDILDDNGVIFIRSPNKDVAGIERDHTHGHTLIHPNIFSTESLKYAANKVGFHLHWLNHDNGYGQSNFIFKKYKPTISAVMIVKNEENNIYDCVSTFRDFVDEIVILDTGSSDNTYLIAQSTGAKVIKSKQFDNNTKYEDFHFANARNEAIEYATSDWILWVDADDRLSGSITKIDPLFDAFNVTIEYGNTIYDQCRIFRNNWGMKFNGAIHEYLVLNDARLGKYNDLKVMHSTLDKIGRTDRNLAILKKEFKLDPSNKRTIFYLAQAHKDCNNIDEAIEYYKLYISLGGNFHDELVMAYYYLAIMYYKKSDFDNSIKTLYEALSIDDRFGELYALLGECYYYKHNYNRALHYFKIARTTPYPNTIMFVEKNRYTTDADIWIDKCTKKLIDCKSNIVSNNTKTIIECRRLGALGDVLCTTPTVKQLKQLHPNSHIRYVVHSTCAEVLHYNRYIDEIIYADNPNYNISNADIVIPFAYPLQDGYPYSKLKKHIIYYFADCASIKLNDDKPILNVPNYNISIDTDKPIITFAVKTGWSKYKEWDLDNWEKLIKELPEYSFVQIGAEGEPKIDKAIYMCGKFSLMESFYLMKQSKLFVGLDSVFNHASYALDVPAVILFGSTSPAGSGYNCNTNLWSGYDCSPCYRENNEISVHKMAPCPYSHKCMNRYMTVDLVKNAILQKLNIHYEHQL